MKKEYSTSQFIFFWIFVVMSAWGVHDQSYGWATFFGFSALAILAGL